jgi:hypothetical protein
MPVRDDGAVVRYSTAPAPLPARTLRAYDPQFLFPGTYNISIYRGDTYEWWFVVGSLGPDGNTPAVLDITNWRFKAEIRASPDAPLQAAMQEVARDNENGVVAMRLTNQQSRLITTSGIWDLEAITPQGWVRTVLRGTVTLVNDVTTGLVEYSTEYGNAKAR